MTELENSGDSVMCFLGVQRAKESSCTYFLGIQSKEIKQHTLIMPIC